MKRHAKDTGPLDVLISSPQRDRNLILEYRGEVAFGPPYFALWVEHRDEYVGPGVKDLYGDRVFWSPDGRYVVLERWLSLDAPDNRLLILDLVSARQCLAARLGAEFLQNVIWHPTESESQRLVTYQVEWCGKDGESVQCAAKLVIDDRLDWTSVNWLNNY